MIMPHRTGHVRARDGHIWRVEVRRELARLGRGPVRR
jgi:hypothetical protein